MIKYIIVAYSKLDNKEYYYSPSNRGPCPWRFTFVKSMKTFKTISSAQNTINCGIDKAFLKDIVLVIPITLP